VAFVVVLIGVIVGTPPSSARMNALGAYASSSTRYPWRGEIVESYDASGVTANGNCSSCVASSEESVVVTEQIAAAGVRVSAVLHLDERNDYNSQCSGPPVSRHELDVGLIQKKKVAHSGLTVQALGRKDYQLAFNPPGVPYTGVITEEQVTNVSGQVRCDTGTRKSSGVFYIPGPGKPLRAGGVFVNGNQIVDTVHYSPTCGYPRDHCRVSVRLNLHRVLKSVGESPKRSGK
jgi:hypothetical protein